MAEKKSKYDLIIIGSGPAAYSASLYASRYKIDHVIIGAMPGGTASFAHRICNFPGFKKITGLELMMKMREQVLEYGVGEIMDKVTGVVKNDDGLFNVQTQSNGDFSSKSVLVAVGTERRELGISSEAKFKGKGVSYCATCDGMFYKDKVVAVLGGSNSANMAAVYLADICKKVYIIYRKDRLRGEELWIDEVMKNEKIEVVFNANVVEFLGDDSLESIRLDKDNMVLDVSGVFVEIGSKPGLDFDLGVDLNEGGYIVVNNEQKTSVEGIYAAGDITTNSNHFEQVVVACSEGAVAANSIYYDLKKGG
jgi:thioredoxin reductase (NADPH)